jgi:hypothetical protein
MQYFLRSELINIDRPLRESLYSLLGWPVSVKAQDNFLSGFSGPSHHQKKGSKQADILPVWPE